MKQPDPKPTKATLARAQAVATNVARARNKSLLEKLAISMSGTPDYSATLRGPVELSGTASGLEMARRTPNAPAITNASIIAQPLNDTSLGSGPTDASKPATGNANSPGTSQGESAPKTEENAASPAGNPGATPTAAAAPQENKPQENKTTENQPAAKTDTAQAKPTSQDQSRNTPPQKKKSRFHVFKKIVPF